MSILKELIKKNNLNILINKFTIIIQDIIQKIEN